MIWSVCAILICLVKGTSGPNCNEASFFSTSDSRCFAQDVQNVLQVKDSSVSEALFSNLLPTVHRQLPSKGTFTFVMAFQNNENGQQNATECRNLEMCLKRSYCCDARRKWHSKRKLLI